MSDLARHIFNIDYPKSDYEWLIVNDGSTDNLQDVVSIISSTYPELQISLINKPNGGIHTAQNCAVLNAKGEYLTRIDSDDFPLPDCLKNKDKALDCIKPEQKDCVAGVVGLCLNSKDMTVRGVKFPEDQQISKGYILKKQGVLGDKNFCIRTEVMRQFLIPEYEDTKWVPEGGYLWLEIDKVYDTLFVNIPMSVCAEANENSYLGNMKVLSLSNIMSTYYQSIYIVNSGKEYYDHKTLFRSYCTLLISILRASVFDCKKYNLKKCLSDIKSTVDKLILIVLYPLVLMYQYMKR